MYAWKGYQNTMKFKNLIGKCFVYYATICIQEGKRNKNMDIFL